MDDRQTPVTGRTQREFLQTALFVDDRALVPDSDDVAEIVIPTDFGDPFDPTDDIDAVDPQDIPRELLPNDAQDVGRTNALVEALADVGVTCSVLAPQMLDEVSMGRIARLARRTDLLIIDWNLGRGTNSSSLIVDLLAQDLLEGGRLRLIVVYTSEDALSALATGLAQAIGANEHTAGSTVAVDDVTLIGTFFRITFVRKLRPGVRYTGLDSGVAGDELASKILEEFGLLIGQGLLQRLAVRALSEVRDQAHHLLSRFNSALDPALIGHRAQTSHRDAVLLALELLGTELSSLVRSADISEMLSQESVLERIDALTADRTSARPWSAKASAAVKPAVSMERIHRFLGTPSDDSRSQVGISANDPSVSSLLLDHGASEAELKQAVMSVEQQFALLATLTRTVQHDQERLAGPTLELGVVVQHPRGHYLLCIQPLCDSVRVPTLIAKARKFHFLTLERSTAELSFDLMIWDSAAVPLLVGSLGSSVEYKFVGHSASQVVQSRRKNGSRFFKTTGNVRLRWVGTMRDAQVRRIVQQLTERLTRVGLDEPHLMVRRP